MSDLTSIKKEAEVRAVISAVETMVKTMEQFDPPIKHFFSKNVYAREMYLPAGALIVGKIHKFENLNILSKGKVIVFSTRGREIIEAPHTFVAEPGAKRVIYAMSDVVWTTIHGTGSRELQKIEDEFIATDYSQIDGISQEELDLIKEAQDGLGSGWNDGGSGLIIGGAECESTGERPR